MSDDGETVPSARFEELSEMVTLATGWLVSAMVNVAVPPASVVTRPLTGVTVTPATSLSVVEIATSATAKLLYAGSVLAAVPVTMEYAMVPSTTKSSTPVTVTVCAIFQFAAVNVSAAGKTVPSVASLDESGIVTSAVGWLVRTTVNVAVPPISVVVRPDVGVTVTPTVSLSVVETATSATAKPL